MHSIRDLILLHEMEGKRRTSVRSRGSEPRGSAEPHAALGFLVLFAVVRHRQVEAGDAPTMTFNSYTLSTGDDSDPESKIIAVARDDDDGCVARIFIPSSLDALLEPTY